MRTRSLSSRQSGPTKRVASVYDFLVVTVQMETTELSFGIVYNPVTIELEYHPAFGGIEETLRPGVRHPDGHLLPLP